MKIALIGATGRVGSRVLPEALARGHRLTLLSPQAPGRLAANCAWVACDAYDSAQVAAAAAGHDALVSAFSPPQDDPQLTARMLAGSEAILRGARASGTRLLMVGGASSLFVAPGVRVLDDVEFPRAWLPSARASLQVLDQVLAITDIDWAYISPALNLVPGERTGRYATGRDTLLRDAGGRSWISFQDLAVAVLDELESPRHTGRRFTVATL